MKQIQNEIISKDKGHFKLINCYELERQEIYSLQYNNKNSILFVGSGKKINAFQFNQLSLKHIGSFFNREYLSNVFSMNKKNVFISGDITGKCKLFQLSTMNSSRYLYQLHGHYGYILNIDMNDQESDLITCCINSTIRFWNKRNIWSCYQTLIQDKVQLSGFCLNKSGNQLISYGSHDYVSVISKVMHKQFWLIIQNISNQLFSGARLSYISDTKFIVQPNSKDFMLVYSKEENQNLFQQTSEMKLKQGSSKPDFLSKIQFVRSKLVLVQKLGTILNCLKLDEHGNVYFQEYIDISQNKFVACMNQDVNYLFIVKGDSYELEIRKNVGF